MKVETVTAASLIEDFQLYPRNDVNDTHINELVKAIQSGAVLPPLIVDKASRRIVDGFHRRRAYIKLLGDDCTVDVQLKDYPDEAALFLDAVQYNAGHGRRLDRQDQTRIVLRLQELHVDERIIASALHVPEQEVRTLAVRIVYDEGGMAIPQKRGLEHMRGKTLTLGQVEAMRSVRSAEVGRLCTELNRLLENELVDYADPRVYAQLRELGRLVTGALKQCRLVQETDAKPKSKKELATTA